MRNIDKLFDNDGKPITMVLVGKSFRGKSYFLKFMLMDKIEQNKLKFGIVFTSTKFNKNYEFLNEIGIKNKIIEGYDDDVLKRYFNNVKNIYEKNGSVEPSFIVFDDIMGCLNNQSQFFINFITTARHLNISVFFAVQYLKGKGAISPTMRCQTTHCLMFKSLAKDNTEALYESYGQQFDTPKEFKKYLEEKTKGKHVGVLYIEHEDDFNKNYIPIKSPKYE